MTEEVPVEAAVASTRERFDLLFDRGERTRSDEIHQEEHTDVAQERILDLLGVDLRHQSQGADVIIAQGAEAGGRFGTFSGLAVTQQAGTMRRSIPPLRVLSFHFGLPAPDLLAALKATGAVVMCSATCVAEARLLRRHRRRTRHRRCADAGSIGGADGVAALAIGAWSSGRMSDGVGMVSATTRTTRSSSVATITCPTSRAADARSMT